MLAFTFIKQEFLCTHFILIIDITYITKIEPIFGTITINENLFVVVSFLNIMNNILVNKTRVLLYLINNDFMQINHHKSYKKPYDLGFIKN